MLRYQVQSWAAFPEKRPDVQQLITAVIKRFAPGGAPDVEVIWQGNGAMLIIAPRSFADRVERRLASPGTLEFRILANRRDHRAVIERARAERAAAEKEGRPVPNEVRDDRQKLLGWWVPLFEAKKAAGAKEDKSRAVRSEERAADDRAIRGGGPASAGGQ